jgi:hypothetical protein
MVRTKYLREWRHANPDKIRKNKKTSYWNNPEKHRKKARDNYRKKHNIQADKKLSEMLDHKSHLSPRTVYKLLYIKEYASEIFESKLVTGYGDITPIFDMVRKDVESFNDTAKSLSQNIADKNLVVQLQRDLSASYENLTYPFSNNH